MKRFRIILSLMQLVRVKAWCYDRISFFSLEIIRVS